MSEFIANNDFDDYPAVFSALKILCEIKDTHAMERIDSIIDALNRAAMEQQEFYM